MRKYTDNELLMNRINNNDISEIKRTLIDNIFFLQGNREEIEKAVQYAIENSDFTFDDNDGSEMATLAEDSYAFSTEKINLLSNYSKERYDALVKLYQEEFGKRTLAENTAVATMGVDDKKSSAGKMAAVAIAAVVIIYIIYQILN